MQDAKKIIFTACHSGKLKLAFTSPDVISTSPKSFLMSNIYFTVLPLFKFLKKHHLPIGQVKTEFTCPIVKSTSLGYRTLLSLHADMMTLSANDFCEIFNSVFSYLPFWLAIWIDIEGASNCL